MDKAWTTPTLRKYLNVEVEVGMQRHEGPFNVKDLIDRFHHLCFFLSACFKRFHFAEISKNFKLLCIKRKAEQTLQSIHIHENSMEASKHAQTSRIISVFWGPGPAPMGPWPQLQFLAPAPTGAMAPFYKM